VRLKEARILEEENFVLKKKREYERLEEEEVPVMGYIQMGTTYAGIL
jgi:hypothetical protein